MPAVDGGDPEWRRVARVDAHLPRAARNAKAPAPQEQREISVAWPKWPGIGRAGRALLAVALLLFAACSEKPQRLAGWTAVLRFENLTGDPEFRWAERAAAEIIAREIGALARTAGAPGPSGQRAQAIAGGAAKIVTGAVAKAGNRLRLDVWIEQSPSGARDSVFATGDAAAGIASLAHAVARKMDGAEEAFPQTNAATLRDYFLGLDAATPQEASATLARAASGDPTFGPAWIAWTEIELVRGERGSAAKILERANSHVGSFAAIDKARLAVVAAQSANDGPAALRALEALSKITRDDPLVWRSLGDLAMNMKNPRAAAAAYTRVTDLQPSDPQSRNLLGYARTASGDFEGAIKAMQEYRQLRPNDPNAFDSLGDVYYRFDKFAEAEKAYLDGQAPGKAAFARVMTGDIVGADQIFSRLMEASRAAKDPAAELRLGTWEFDTGRRDKGLSRLENFAVAAERSSQRDLSSISYSQLTLWNLMLGNGVRAEQSARKAAATASNPGTAQIAAICAVLADVKGLPMNPNALAQASGYGLLLSRQFSAAVPVLKSVNSRTLLSPEDDTPVMLAWAQLASGQPGDAASLLSLTPVPQVSRPNPFHVFTFPRIVFLRAQAAELAGRREEAFRQYRLFATLSGPTPLVFGEEKVAQEKLK